MEPPRGVQKKGGFSSTLNIIKCGLQLEGKLAQFICIINIQSPSASGGLSSGQTGKPNSIVKTSVL